MTSKFIILTEVYENSGFFKYSPDPGGNDTQRKIFSSSNDRGFSLRKVLVNVNHITSAKDYSNFIERLG